MAHITSWARECSTWSCNISLVQHLLATDATLIAQPMVPFVIITFWQVYNFLTDLMEAMLFVKLKACLC